MLRKEPTNIKKTTNNLMIESIDLNKNKIKDDPKLIRKLKDIINIVRIEITNQNNDKWLILELIMEKISYTYKLGKIKIKTVIPEDLK